MSMNKAVGGKTVTGASLGMLMLESQFPRIAGDGGNASTWPFPVLFKVIRDATPERVVTKQGKGLLDAFIEEERRDGKERRSQRRTAQQKKNN